MSWIGKAFTVPQGKGRTLIRWASGGWIFFIAENAILSENRTFLIETLGDDKYHLVYGTISTIATASIGYAYYKIASSSSTKSMPSNLMLLKNKPTLMGAFGGWILITTGMVMASQAAPKVQIPVSLGSDNNGKTTLQVHCPFDFSDKYSQGGSNVGWDGQVHGLDRITRHPGLWSIGLIGLGQAVLSSHIPKRIWWMGPAAVAWLGGSHTDSRFRRGLGGTLSPTYESLTSNVPFVAMISGKQGSKCWERLWKETKPLNAIAAVALSSLWILRKIR